MAISSSRRHKPQPRSGKESSCRETASECCATDAEIATPEHHSVDIELNLPEHKAGKQPLQCSSLNKLTSVHKTVLEEADVTEYKHYVRKSSNTSVQYSDMGSVLVHGSRAMTTEGTTRVEAANQSPSSQSGFCQNTNWDRIPLSASSTDNEPGIPESQKKTFKKRTVKGLKYMPQVNQNRYILLCESGLQIKTSFYLYCVIIMFLTDAYIDDMPHKLFVTM